MRIGPFEYRECPVLFLEPEDEQLVAQVRSGVELPTGPDRLYLPARYVEGMKFLGTLGGVADGN